MSIDAAPDWWKTMFDEVYLQTDARSVCNEEITRREVDLICQLLPLRAGDRILDLCGGHGRHSLELCSRGFTGCVLLDYSSYLIGYARARAAEYNYHMDFIQADARTTGLPHESFDHVLILGNSLGYIPEPVADREILAEAKRVLRTGGWLLIDITDGTKLKDSFSPTAWHETGDDIVVCRARKMEGNTLHARELVMSKHKGTIRDRNYAVRLYGPRTLRELMVEAGFTDVNIHTDFSPHQSEGDYGFMNHRMLAAGQKP